MTQILMRPINKPVVLLLLRSMITPLPIAVLLLLGLLIQPQMVEVLSIKEKILHLKIRLVESSTKQLI